MFKIIKLRDSIVDLKDANNDKRKDDFVHFKIIYPSVLYLNKFL